MTKTKDNTEMSAQQLYEYQKQQEKEEFARAKAESPTPDAAKVQMLDMMQKQIDSLHREVSLLKQSSDSLSKKEIISIAENINRTLRLVGEIDELGKMILDRKEKLMNDFQRLKNNNYLDELATQKDLVISLMFGFIEKSNVLYLALRNELGQLQSKIMAK